MKRRISAERARFLAKEIGLDFLASVLIAVSIKSFQAPNQIIGGGVAGIATLVNFLTGLPIGTVSFLINVPLLLVGYRKIGRRFILSTLRVLVILAVTMDYLLAWIPAYHGNLLLAALFG
ncbi:MAG TPA: YitT family protein, partial [Candidatus Fimivivens faecavium]|nr:YitT family protein [Candidatus Fimivivens faecavium]